MLGLTIEFVEGSWFTPLPPDEDFDLIVCNPPYIAEADEHLKYLSHEPTLALVGGKDGLDCIRQITHQSPAYLKPGGWLILEHGFDQRDSVVQLFKESGFQHLLTRDDFAGIPRCVAGNLSQKPV